MHAFKFWTRLNCNLTWIAHLEYFNLNYVQLQKLEFKITNNFLFEARR